MLYNLLRGEGNEVLLCPSCMSRVHSCLVTLESWPSLWPFWCRHPSAPDAHCQWCSDSTFLPTSLISCTQRELFCHPATVDHLWSRKHSKLLCHPLGYDHNLCKEVKLQPWRWALSEFVLPSLHFLSLRYALDFSLHLYNYSYQSFSSVQFSRSVVSDSLRPHGLQHTRPPCQSSTPGVY